jgi:hypothetical protein
MITVQSEKLDLFFSEIIDNSPLSSIEFFEDLSDDYNFERTWDVPDQWFWRFDNSQDLKNLLDDYNVEADDLRYI